MNKLFYENNFSPKALCFTGLFVMPSFVFMPSTCMRILLFLFFWFLVLLSVRKSKPIFVIITFFCITAFNLLIPYGQILFAIGSFKITSGSLEAGIHRSVTFLGLLMLSKLSIREDLQLLGSFGKLLAESLRIFNVMMNRKTRITAKNFISDIDLLMFELSEQESPASLAKKVRTTFIGYVILITVVILSWLPWLTI